MFIETCFYYPELEQYVFSDDYLEMMEYTIKAYKDGLISDDLTIKDTAAINMALIDMDAIRWFTGNITTKELYENYKRYFMRQ